MCLGQGYYYPEERHKPIEKTLKKGEAHVALPVKWLQQTDLDIQGSKAFGLIRTMKSGRECSLGKLPVFLIRKQPHPVAKVKMSSLIVLVNCLQKAKGDCSLSSLNKVMKLPSCHQKPRIIYGLHP